MELLEKEGLMHFLREVKDNPHVVRLGTSR